MQEPAQLVSLGGVHHKSVAGKRLGILATLPSYLHSYLLIPLLSSLLMGSFTAYFIQEKKYQRKIKSSSTKSQILLAPAAMLSFLSCHSGWKVLLAVKDLPCACTGSWSSKNCLPLFLHHDPPRLPLFSIQAP